jgi:hypothetical protein
MDAAKAARETPRPDFGATVIEPPRRPATPFVPQAAKEAQPAVRPPAPVAYPPAGAALPTPPSAPPSERRKSSRKIGFGFVLLLLFLMLLVFVLAVVLD